MRNVALPASRPVRIALLTVTGVLLVGFALEFAWLWGYIGSQNAIGTDHGFYQRIGEHWLDTGEFYLPHQLAGPYTVATDVDVMYPPIAIPFFAALHWLPYPLWWAVPLAVIGAVLFHLRPAAWTWPILALCLAWPRNLSDLIYGNSNMWVVAAIAGGLVLGWPAVLVLLKPSLAPFALVGGRHRSWWLALIVLAIASLLTLDLWREYLAALRNSDAQWYWSLEDVVPMSAPVVAWLGRSNGGFATLRSLLAWRPTWPALLRPRHGRSLG